MLRSIAELIKVFLHRDRMTVDDDLFWFHFHRCYLSACNYAFPHCDGLYLRMWFLLSLLFIPFHTSHHEMMFVIKSSAVWKVTRVRIFEIFYTNSEFMWQFVSFWLYTQGLLLFDYNYYIGCLTWLGRLCGLTHAMSFYLEFALSRLRFKKAKFFVEMSM